jgi:hypothetical protein
MLLAGAGDVTKLSLQNGTYDPCHGIATGSALLISIVTALPMIPIYGGAARPSTAPSRERRGFSFGAGADGGMILEGPGGRLPVQSRAGEAPVVNLQLRQGLSFGLGRAFIPADVGAQMFHELVWLGVVLAVVGILIVAALASRAIRQSIDRRSEARDNAQADYSRRLNTDDGT